MSESDSSKIERMLVNASVGHEAEEPFLPHQGGRRIILMPGQRAIQFEFDGLGALRSITHVQP